MQLMQRERKAKKIVFKESQSYDVKVMFDFQVMYVVIEIVKL